MVIMQVHTISASLPLLGTSLLAIDFDLCFFGYLCNCVQHVPIQIVMNHTDTISAIQNSRKEITSWNTMT